MRENCCAADHSKKSLSQEVIVTALAGTNSTMTYAGRSQRYRTSRATELERTGNDTLLLKYDFGDEEETHMGVEYRGFRNLFMRSGLMVVPLIAWLALMHSFNPW